MTWTNFPLTAYTVSILLILAFSILFFPIKRKLKVILANTLTISALIISIIFITGLWIHLERPPLRTLGETRLLYSVFLILLGIITFNRWKYFWFLAFTNLMALVFIFVNLAHPETYNKTLMPALQSYWFVPHVIVYILSYAVLGVSWLISIRGLIKSYPNLNVFGKIISVIFYPIFFIIEILSDEKNEDNHKILKMADDIVYIGFSFLTLGITFGALWAKEAWGNYWTWDPKETWALLTLLVYLIYIHIRTHHKDRTKLHLWILSISFVFLLSAWFGVNYMPSAKNSVHTYSQQE
ncbi:MAG: cytochrome C assembly protein [Bacteroidetes bacterium]|nr:MAG: cytochrome C assembly protein [Bacteroidota bacterium]